MLNISKYLEKFLKNVESGELMNNTIVDIVKKITDINLKLEDFEIKNNIVLLKSSPAVKNKIFIHKEDIIKEINSTLSLKIINIR